MVWEQGPSYVAMSAVWIYWLGVLFMAVRVRSRGAASAGLIPKQTRERLIWIIWVPVITGWILFPWLSITQRATIWQMPEAALQELLWLSLRWIAATVTVLCLGATIYCWRWMGRNWRVGVATDDRTELITAGPFSQVRHPIYSLSILMMICTLLAVPIWPLLLATVLHLLLMNLKARNEEDWMTQVHGRAYQEYRGNTGRFLPARHKA